MIRTPVALFIFNRPDTTARVFESIRSAAPAVLLIVADGPRANRPGEEERCAAARAIVGRVDWTCEVMTNFSDINLGCRRRVSSGLDWVFEQVPEAIILEDDCLADPSFFPYCEELIQRYRNDTRIMSISGNNFQAGPCVVESYYFSRYPLIWGWASWRRAWKYYDVEMKLWPRVRDSGWLREVLPERAALEHFSRQFNLTYDGKIDTWDYQWIFAFWINSGLAILPNVNLVSNIGFNSDATHTTEIGPLSNLSTRSIALPLKHPEYVLRNLDADAYSQKQFYQISLVDKIKRKLGKLLRYLIAKMFRSNQ